MKKKYKKPQVIEVKLTVQNPILGDCDYNNDTVEYGNCNVSTGCLF